MLFLCIINNTNGQTGAKVDSLVSVLESNAKDSLKIAAAGNLILHYEYNNLDSVMFYLSYLKEKGDAGNDPAMINFYHFYLKSNINNKVADINLEQSTEYFEQGLSLCQKLDNKHQEVIFYHLIGSTCVYSNNPDQAIEYFFKQNALATEYELWEEVCRSYQMIALTLSQSQNSKKAFQYLEKAEEVCQTHDIKEDMCLFVVSGLADAYLLDKQYENAIVKYKQAISLAEKINQEYFALIFKGNLASCYIALEKFEIAKQNYKEVLNTLYEKFPNVKDNIAIFEYKSTELYYETKAYKEAIQYGLKIDTSRLNTSIQMELSDILGNCFLEIGNTKKAVEYFQTTLILKDSFYTSEREIAVAEIEAKYESSEKERLIMETEAKLEQKKQEKNTILLILIGLASLLALGLFSFLQLKKKNKQLDVLNNELTLNNQKMQKFNYTLSHDALGFVNNILNYSYTYLEFEEDYLQDKKLLNKHLSRILKNTKTLKKLLVNLLSLAKLDSKDTIPKTKVSLHHLLGDVIENLDIEINQKNAKLTFSEFPVIHGNQGLLFELFRNLIDNAIKYSKEDINPVIHLESSITKNQHEITIKDNGIGISNERLQNIFSPFSRITTNRIEGTGLGLSICKHIVELHSGTISVNSVPNEGTTFTISLPV